MGTPVPEFVDGILKIFDKSHWPCNVYAPTSFVQFPVDRLSAILIWYAMRRMQRQEWINLNFIWLFSIFGIRIRSKCTKHIFIC